MKIDHKTHKADTKTFAGFVISARDEIPADYEKITTDVSKV